MRILLVEDEPDAARMLATVHEGVVDWMDPVTDAEHQTAARQP